MNEKAGFGTFEAVSLVTLFIVSKIFYTSIAFIVKVTGTASWYATLISCVVSIVFFLLLYLLMKRFPGKDIAGIFETVLGKAAGKFLILVFSAYFIYYAATNLREFVEMIKAYNLPVTPPSLLIATFIAVSVLIAWYGLECLARIASLSFIPILAGVTAILLMAIPLYDNDYLKPYLGYGLQNSLLTGVLRSSAYDEVFILAVIINSIHGIKAFRKAGVTSLVIAGVIFSLSILCYLMSFLYSVGIENLSGLYQLSRNIYFNRFFQRVESIFLFVWVISALITVAAAFFISILLYCQTFGIKNHRPLLPPFAFLLFMLTMLPQSLIEVININLKFTRQYSLFLIYCVPVLVLILAWITGKKGRDAHV